jgi:hypothetical protein
MILVLALCYRLLYGNKTTEVGDAGRTCFAIFLIADSFVFYLIMMTLVCKLFSHLIN